MATDNTQTREEVNKLIEELKELNKQYAEKIASIPESTELTEATGDIDVYIKKMPGAKTPYYASEHANACDIYTLSDEPIIVPSNESVKIHTGIYLEVPNGVATLAFARSGLACKFGLAPANKVGLIDCDYRGEILIFLHNHSNKDYVINDPVSTEDGTHERIAQLMFVPSLRANFIETDELSETARCNGGFGHSGK